MQGKKMHMRSVLLRPPTRKGTRPERNYASGTRVLVRVAGANVEGTVVEDLGASGPDGDHSVRVRIPVDPQYGEDHVVDLPAEFIVEVVEDKPRRRYHKRHASAQTPTP